MKTKECRKCGETKPESRFGNRWNAKDGKHPYCFECKRLYEAAYRAANPEQEKVRQKKWRDKNKQQYLDYQKMAYQSFKEERDRRARECRR